MQAVQGGQLVEEAGDALAGDRHVDDLARAFAGEVVDDVEDPEPAARAQAVADKSIDQRCCAVQPPPTPAVRGRRGACVSWSARRDPRRGRA